MPARWLFVLPLLLAACSGRPLPEEVAPTQFGAAVRHNMEAQLANPDRAFETLGPASGERGALAVGRYQTDRVQRPVQVDTRSE